MRVDLAKVRAALEAAGVASIDARVMLIAALDAEVTISGGGRILIKAKDPALAERMFDRVLSFLPDGGPSAPATGDRKRTG
jgi:hypothetical protein